MALVTFVATSDIEWYGAGPHPAELKHYKDVSYWDVLTPRYPHLLAFETREVIRVPAHRMDDREPSLDGYYMQTTGKHRKGN